MENKFLESAFIEVFKLLLKDASNEIKLQIQKQSHVFENAAASFRLRATRQFGKIKVFGMNQPMDLSQIYVNTTFSDTKVISDHSALKGLKLLEYLKSHRSSTTLECDELLSKYKSIVILGKPGAGKSVFLKSVVLRALNDKNYRDKIPIYINLKDCSDSDSSIFDHCVKLFDSCNVMFPKEFLLTALKSGKCLVLLDGIDEIRGESLDLYITEIKHLVNKYHSNSFITSCRDSVYEYWFESFVEVEILPFSIPQVKEFIQKWFLEEPKVAKRCFDEVAENPESLSFASTPLLLTLMCITFDFEFTLHSNKGELFRDALEVYLRKWDSQKRVIRGTRFPSINTKRKEAIFSFLALNGVIEDKVSWDEKSLEEQMQIILKPWDFEEDIGNCQPITLMKELDAKHSIFVEKTKRKWGFYHLTFQEYYAAKYLIDNTQKINFIETVKTKFEDPKWREIICISSSLISDSSELVKVLNEDLLSIIKELELKKHMSRIKGKLRGTSTYSPILSRHQAVYFIAYQLIFIAIDIDKSISKFSKENNNLFQKALISVINHTDIDRFSKDVLEDDYKEIKLRRNLVKAFGFTDNDYKQIALFSNNNNINLDKKIQQNYHLTVAEDIEDELQVMKFGRAIERTLRKISLVTECVATASSINTETRITTVKNLKSIAQLITL